MARKTSLDHFRKALKEITGDKLQPVYVFVGKEKFFIDRLLEHVQNILPEELKDFNFDMLYGRESTVDQVLDIARSYPMMAEMRIVVVRDYAQLADKVSAPGKEAEQSSPLNNLIPYLNNPNESTLLVLTDEKKPNGRTKLGKALKKGKKVSYYHFDEVKDYKIPDWITEWTAFKHKKKLEPGVAEKLAQSAGSNLLVLAAEIDKAATYVNDKEFIDAEAVKNVVGTYKEYTVFELKDAIVAHDTNQALFIADQMLQLSGNPTGEVFKTVGYLYSMFTKIWQIRILASKKKNKKQIQNEIGVNNTWYFNQLWKQAEAFGLLHIHNAFETLLDADRAMKGFSQMDDRGIFLMTIERLTRIK